MTHAFFKACLFLGSGSVIHAMGGEQDMRKMGGLQARTCRHLLDLRRSAALAIAGVPPLRRLLLARTRSSRAAAAQRRTWMLWAVGLLTARPAPPSTCSALVFLTFFGEFRGTHEQEHHLHESPPSMTVPLLDPRRRRRSLAGCVGVPDVASSARPELARTTGWRR